VAPRRYAGTDIAALAAMRLSLIGLFALGCGGGVDDHIEDQITIQQGVYGLLISGCDTPGCLDQPAANEPVIVYAPGQPERSVASNGRGIYEIDLPAGDYTLCTYSCTPVTVAVGTVRYDWTSGPGGGYWNPR
jgi:hypothetical protein